MEMEKLTTYKPIIGDDDPYITIALRDLPKGYGFDGLVFDPGKPLTYALKTRLVDVATRYYRNYEIVGETFADFRDNLQLDLDLNVDTFEKMLVVYNDDIAKPTQSREIRKTYDILDTSTGSEDTTNSESINLSETFKNVENATNEESVTNSETNKTSEVIKQTDINTASDNTTNNITRNETENNSATSNGSSNGESTDYDIPLDNGTAQGTSKQISTNENTTTNNVNVTRGITEERTDVSSKSESMTRDGTNTLNGEKNVTGGRSTTDEKTSSGEKTSTDSKTATQNVSSAGENKKVGTEVEYWSDVGVAPNYQLLNGFLDNNRTLERVFIDYFKNNFMVLEVYYG